jgi:ribosomal protein S18 acetylase RimI-like enzyme
MHETLAVAPARPEEWESAFQLIFQSGVAEERETRVANALRLLRQGELDPQGVLVIRGVRRLLGAMVCLPVPGASGLVWPPQAALDSRREEIEDQLLGYATVWLKQRGAKLAQTLLAPQETYLAASLQRYGFVHITALWYLRHDLNWSGCCSPDAGHLTYHTYQTGGRSLFQQTLWRTYEGTLDCPEVNGIRSLDEILEGHRAQGMHDPGLWWLALAEGCPVGVLLLTTLPEFQGLDVSYVGVVPEARRQGWGRELACKALQVAREAKAAQVTLSVDTRNRPAWNLYLSLGFEPFDQREVYLAIWNKENHFPESTTPWSR